MSGKVVIVTGGSRGLGASIVAALRQAGYRVATCSRSRSDFIDAQERDAAGRADFLWRACAVGESDQVEAFVKEVAGWAHPDPIYGLVNNAGIAQAGILATFPVVEIEKLLRVNLLGPLQMARAVSQQMLLHSHGGRIVNISSIIGTRGYNGLAAYSATKAGLDGLTRALARELGRRQITVNSVAPGYVRTEMSATLTEDQLDQIVRRTPLGRLPTAEDVAGLVTFLLGEQAGMITGQTILVDGGISC